MNQYKIDLRNIVVSVLHLTEAIPLLDGYSETNGPVELGWKYDRETNSFSEPPTIKWKERISEIDSILDQIDTKMIRCIDEIQSGEDADGKAAEQRAKLKAEKNVLREERLNLYTLVNGGGE